MFKKIAVLTMAVMVLIGFTGCSLTDAQIKSIAQNAGLFTAVTWIAYDNPSQGEKDVVKNIMDIVKTNAVNIQTGMTYSAAIYPVVEKYVSATTNIPPNYKPLVLAGSAAALNGIDLLFATYPSWKKDEAIALMVVESFTDGVKQGLSLSNQDPLIIQANAANVLRTKALKKQ